MYLSRQFIESLKALGVSMIDFRKHQPRNKYGKYSSYTFLTKFVKWVIERWKEKQKYKQRS